MIACLLLASGLAAAAPAGVPIGSYLYRTTLLQAAPGKLLEVVELWKAGWPGTTQSGDEPPIAMRHCGHGEGADTAAPRRLGRRLQERRGPAREGDVHSRAREGLGDRASDPATGAGDERDTGAH